jgi:hypothetical protein
VGLFDRLFGRRQRQPELIDEINRILQRFTTATLAGVDAEDIGRYPLKQHKVMAFHYGAIEYLAQLHGLDENRKLGVFVGFINRYFNLPVHETGSIAERLAGFAGDPEQQRYVAAGRAVFRRWHEDNDRRAPLELGAMLKST